MPASTDSNSADASDPRGPHTLPGHDADQASPTGAALPSDAADHSAGRTADLTTEPTAGQMASDPTYHIAPSPSAGPPAAGSPAPASSPAASSHAGSPPDTSGDTSAGASDESDPPLESYHCGARNRAGKPCRGRALPNGRCRLHGGKSLAGAASPAFKTGRYSKYLLAALPSRFKDRFLESMSDPELLSLRSSVALLDVRLLDTLQKYSDSDAGDFRRQLVAKWEQFKPANAAQAATDEERAVKSDKIRVLLGELDKVISLGAEEEAAWASVAAAIKDRANLVEKENRRLIESQQMISVEQAMGLVISVANAVQRAIPDLQLQSRVGIELERATGLDHRTLSLPAPASQTASVSDDDHDEVYEDDEKC